MAVTVSRYNHTAKLFANGEVSLANLRFMLLSNGASFTASHTSVDDVAGALAGSPDERTNEVYGFGWTQGGEAIANAAVTVVNTNEAKLDGDPITVQAVGGSIGPAPYGLVYDANSGNALIWVDFDGAQEAGEGTDFKYTPNANGIVRWVTPA